MAHRRRFPCGVVEGFYGRPWAHAARLSMIKFLRENGFNTYIYAPKSDPYLRSSWRRKHPPRTMKKLEELMEAAKQSEVEFVLAVSPGLDIVYSSMEDQRILLEKLRAASTDSSWVGIFLDDIGPRLTHASDKSRFRSLGKAHLFLLNDMYDELAKDGTRLMFCPTYYANEYLGKKAPTNEYLQELGDGLEKEVDVLWTGRSVVATEITEGDVEEFARVIRRKPFLWDNYPVNDYYHSTKPGHDRPRLNIGPFEGRSPGILHKLAGYVSNPATEPEASKIPLLTLHDYLNDPSTYKPRKSFVYATWRIFSGSPPYGDVNLLMDCLKANPFDMNEAETLRTLTRELMESFVQPNKTWRILSTKFAGRLNDFIGLKELMLERKRNAKLLTEFGPFFKKIEELAALGLVCLNLSRARREDGKDLKSIRKLKAEARRRLAKAKANRVQGLGEVVFDSSLSDLGLRPVRMKSPLIEFCEWSLNPEINSEQGLR